MNGKARLLPGVSTALANAIREVNAAFNRIPEVDRPDAASFDPLQEEIDAACLAGDRDRALAAVRAWRQHWLREFDRYGGSR